MTRPTHPRRIQGGLLCINCDRWMTPRSATVKGYLYLTYRCPSCRKMVSETRAADRFIEFQDRNPDVAIQAFGWRFGAKPWVSWNERAGRENEVAVIFPVDGDPVEVTSGFSARQVANMTGVSVSTVYRALRKKREKEASEAK